MKRVKYEYSENSNELDTYDEDDIFVRTLHSEFHIFEERGELQIRKIKSCDRIMICPETSNRISIK